LVEVVVGAKAVGCEAELPDAVRQSIVEACEHEIFADRVVAAGNGGTLKP
jgi:hypothetical protein